MEEPLPEDPKVNHPNQEHPTPNPDPNSLITDHPQEFPSSCQFPSKPFKAIAALIFLICSGLVCTFTLVLTNQIVPEVQPLCDLVMDNVPRLQEGLIVFEIIMLVSAFISFVTIILHSCRLIIFRRFFFISGLLYIYRSITMALTVLPKPDMEWDCPKISGKLTADIIYESIVQMSSGGFVSLWGAQKLCGDYIFSGHTMCLVLAWMVVKEYGPRKVMFLQWISLSLAIVGTILLVLGKGHYTLDVVIAYWITTRVWWVYHTLATHPVLRENTKHNCLRMFWWSRVVVWLEEGVEGPLPEGVSVPLPRVVRKSFLGRNMGCWRKEEEEDTSSGSSNSF